MKDQEQQELSQRLGELGAGTELKQFVISIIKEREEELVERAYTKGIEKQIDWQFLSDEEKAEIIKLIKE